MMLFVLTVSGARARTIIVPKEVNSVQTALTQAKRGDTVFLHNGTYYGPFTLQPHVTLRGQHTESVILSGKRQGPVVIAANYAGISHCTIEHGDKGILCKNTNTYIHHTVIRNNKTGIHCLVSLPRIRNNIIHGNSWSGIYCELIGYSPQSEIAHNIIADNGYSGVTLTRKSEVVAQHNVFLNNKQFGIFVDDHSRKSRVQYNNFHGNRRPANYYADMDESNIFEDPRYPSLAFSLDSSVYNNPVLRNKGKNGADIGLMPAHKKIIGDSDNDRIPDNVDKCLNEKEDIDQFEDSDGCPDYDNDGDGIYDEDDECPHTAEDFDQDRDADGCPDTDSTKSDTLP